MKLAKPFALVLAAALSLAIAAPAARAQTVTIGHPNLSFYEVTTAVIQLMLERSGISTITTVGGHATVFPKVANGDVDLFVAAWLPDAHGAYWKEYGAELVKVGTLYDDAKLYWAVPAYIPEADVKSVADLKKPEVAAKMFKTIRGTLPDSGLMIGSKKIFDAYGLGDAGYELAPGPAKEWLANFNERIEKQDWFVMPLWQPQYLNKAYKLRVLKEPQQLLGGANTAYLVASKDYAASMPRKQRDMLARIELSVKAVTELDHMVNVGGMTPKAAARRWISEHSDTVGYWINGEN